MEEFLSIMGEESAGASVGSLHILLACFAFRINTATGLKTSELYLAAF
jgi:hypothetical protein